MHPKQEYLKQAGARQNLKVVVNAPVVKVLSPSGVGEDFVASGVEFVVGGTTHTVSTTSSGEVILSAGYVSVAPARISQI